MKNKAGPVLTPAIVGLITDGGDPGMTCMAIEEIRAFALESPERMKLVGKIAAMTAEEFSELLSLMEYCWARVQAGESIEAVVAEWKKEAKGA